MVQAFEIPDLVSLDVPACYVLLTRQEIGGASLLGLNVFGVPVGQFVYRSKDCTGMPLVPSDGLLAQVEVVGSTVFYPVQPSGVTSGSSVESDDQS